ncbi:MAG: hypothetical protein JSS99_14175 [Actinobacteria bacterium]|nr:hypothetical protein [Actinomycetota bacterium]
MADGKSNGRSSSRAARGRGELPDYSILDPRDLPPGPDVLLDVPVVKVDEIDVEVDDLRAQVAVVAEVRDLVQISVGAEASLGRVELKIEGVEAQALLKARLDNVTLILERVLTTLDRNPELLESLGRTVEQVGEGGGRLLSETGEAVDQIGEGAEGAVEDVGRGAGQAVGEVGEGAGEAVQQVGEGAQQGVAGVGRGVRQATEGLAQGGPPSRRRRRRRGG